jgi:sulfate adenylyltransferase subunit 2
VTAWPRSSAFDLLVHINPDGIAQGIGPFTHGSNTHTHVMKTLGLRQALDKYGFDAAFGGARRDEEKSAPRSESSRSATRQHSWDPKNPAAGDVENL